MLQFAKYIKNCSYKTSNLYRKQGAHYIIFHTPNIKISHRKTMKESNPLRTEGFVTSCTITNKSQGSNIHQHKQDLYM
jgi:hypothetical protein